MASHRMAQLSEVIKQELGLLFTRELELPASTLVTITKVTTSRDLSYADVHISVLPTEQETPVLKKIESERRELQRILARTLFITEFPTLRFHPDRTEAKADHIERLLDSLSDPR